MKDYHQAEIYLHAGNNLTSIDKFSLAFELQLEIFRTKHDQPNLARLENSIIKLEAAGIPALACIGWRNAGIISRKLKEFSKAAKYYKTALSLATKHDLSLLRTQIYIALATLNSNMGNYNAAREALNKVKFSESLDPIIPSKFEILAVIESHEGNVANSIELVKQALEINLKLDNVALLPAECMHLGEAYENHFKNLDQAEYYYKIGYDHCIRYAENGISLTGDRKQVVDAYVRLLKLKDKSSPSSTKHSHQDPFTFSEGKPWKQIKDIFQHQLILHHSLDQRNSKSMARKLALPPTTLYSLQDRLKQRGYLLPQKGVTTTEESHELSGFIQQHTDLSWGEINKIFEREIMHHLYEKYGYNKHRMASILKISYPSIIKMTRELTQVDEHLLPN
ncbi:hypothetical protein HQ531_07300 [bacterium]|nr:hypothetical protein [bacterium]